MRIDSVALLDVDGCSDFLRLLVRTVSRKPKQVGYSQVARAAGFRSRSYFRELVLGKRPLTREAFEQIKTLVEDDAEVAQYFTLLTQRDCPSLFRLRASTREDLPKKLARLRNRLRQRTQVPASAPAIYGQVTAPLVYAALDDERWTPLTIIARRTKLTTAHAQRILKDLAAQDLVEIRADRYRSQNRHLIFDVLGGSTYFKNFYLAELEQARNAAEMHFASDDRLFLGSAVLIQTSQLKKFRAELRALLLKYIDDIEDNEGDRVALLTVSLRLAGDETVSI
ncbi:MAG: hypothetical protein JST16_13225 [Bdellovibrionales bacterium]|nr:hypothetical protein [Bdellovibrionales bacterium]